MLRIRLVMRQEGRKIRWLAGRLGVNEGHVSRLLRGNRTWTPELRERAKAALGRGDELFDEVASAVRCPVCGGEAIVEVEGRPGERARIDVCPTCKGLGIVIVAEEKETRGQGDTERESSAAVVEAVPW